MPALPVISISLNIKDILRNVKGTWISEEESVAVCDELLCKDYIILKGSAMNLEVLV